MAAKGEPNIDAEISAALAAETAKTAGVAKASSGMSAGMLLGVVGGTSVAMLAGGFCIAYFVLPGRIASSLMIETPPAHLAPAHATSTPDAHGSPKPEEPKKEDAHGKKEDGHGKKEDAHGKKPDAHGGGGAKATKDVSQDFILSEIYVNVLGTRGGRVLKASLYFEAPEEVRQHMEKIRPKVIDIVSQILASKTMDEVTADDARGILRSEILRKVNAIMEIGKVQNVYFLDLIVQ